MTISKTPTGQYYAAFTCETVIQKLPPKPNALGIDLGIKDLLITSDKQKVKESQSSSKQKLKTAQIRSETSIQKTKRLWTQKKTHHKTSRHSSKSK